MLDQPATGVGGAAVGVFTAGVVAPIAAAAVGGVTVSFEALLLATPIAFAFAAALLAVAARLRGRAKQADDDAPVVEAGGAAYIEASKSEEDSR